ncbi:hypothetical protein HanLR1_Chr02g0054141 [Helianthus annuus]|nr:hypothetical protein HanHA89_Chr02g0056571 [Helianthus annuus]KAJ0777159.1 hypothetical protein HanLR1_Chr02g0054141 [Helianthus annuus]
MLEILLSEAKDEENLKDDLKTFTTLLIPLLDEIHSVLVRLLLTSNDPAILENWTFAKEYFSCKMGTNGLLWPTLTENQSCEI